MKYKRTIIMVIATAIAGAGAYLYVDPIGSRLTVTTESDWDRAGSFEATQTTNSPAFLIYTGQTDESKRKSRLRLLERCWEFSQRPGFSGYCETTEGNGRTCRWFSGTADTVVGSNLDTVVRLEGTGYWTRVNSGYVFSFDEPIGHLESGPDLPPLTVFYKEVEPLRSALESHLKLKISDQNHLLAWLDPGSPDDFRNASIERARDQYRFGTTQRLTRMELAAQFVTHFGMVAETNAGGLMVKNPAGTEVLPARVRKLVSEFRQGGFGSTFSGGSSGQSVSWWNCPQMYFMPPGSARELEPLLDDKTPEVVGLVLETLLILKEPVDRDKLYRILSDTSRDKGQRRLAGELLARLGDDRAVGHLERLARFSDSDQETILAVGLTGTQAAAEAQRRMINFRLPAVSGYRSRTISSTAHLPARMATSEARDVLKLAVDYGNRYFRPRYARKGIRLAFSPDGMHAQCILYCGYYHGPLAAGGSSYIVRLKKINKWWFVTGGWPGSDWIS